MTDDDASLQTGDPGPAGSAKAITVAMLPGDGVGPEVLAEVAGVAEAFRRAGLLDACFEVFDWNAERYLGGGEALPPDGIDRLRGFDAVLVGAYGDPRVADHEHARQILLGIRRQLDLFVNVRPVRCLAECLNPLKSVGAGVIDMVFVRENTEGLYSGVGGVVHAGTDHELAVEEMVATHHGVRRVLEAAFAIARSRPRRRLTLVDKGNVLRHVGGLWQRVFRELAASTPEVEADHLYVDAAAMWLVKDPGRFDVVVSENLLGDILTDLAAPLQGGLGMAPSANLHPGWVSMFEPVHGSAPDLVGTGRANPIAAILSFALLLRHLGHVGLAGAVERAVEDTVASGVGTPDIGGRETTRGVGQAVRERLQARLAA